MRNKLKWTQEKVSFVIVTYLRILDVHEQRGNCVDLMKEGSNIFVKIVPINHHLK